MINEAEFGVPFLVFAIYYSLLIFVLRVCGLRLLYFGRVTREKAPGWRRLRRWQFVTIERLLSYTVPILLFFGAQQYMDSKLRANHRHHDLWWEVMIFTCCGIWIGLDLWKKLWKHEYDQHSTAPTI